LPPTTRDRRQGAWGTDRRGNFEERSTNLERPEAEPIRSETMDRLKSGQDRSEGLLPGAEFPMAVYGSVLAGFAWMLVAAWLVFGTNAGTDLDLAVITVLGTVFLGIPVILFRTAAGHSRTPRPHWREFLSSSVDTATGPLPGWKAWLQVILIPAALAIGATVIGGAYALLG
jgi:hypothetical protein